MKKNHLLLVIACVCLFPTFQFAQGTRKKQVASQEQLSARSTYVPRYSLREAEAVHPVRSALPDRRPGSPPAHGRVTANNPIQIGTAGNIFTCVTTEQNQVAAVDSLDVVVFIHRNDHTVYGGSSGNLRYDVSIDGGTTFSNDVGVLNPLMSRLARYPNITVSNYFTGTNPLNAQFLYYAPTLDPPATAFDGHVYGIGAPATSGTPVTTEHYAFQGQSTHLPGGLCQSARGVYWATELEGDGSVAIGDVFLYKGTYDSGTNDVAFVRWDTLVSNNSVSFNGNPHLVGSNIAFAPDGQTGWVVWLGDLVGGPDSTYLPVVSKTTDCGDTWSTPVEVNINNVPWIKDTLQTLWTDSLGNPASNGRATCAFDFDLTVDGAGNPHIAVVICSGIDYAVSSGLAKFLGDITTTDGGATWDVDYISPVLTFRTQDFGTGTIVNMDNYVQISRDEGGCNLFFSWADSDTCLVTGNQNGIGFGESDNLAPNLRISAKNVSSGMKTYPQLVTDGDLIWEGAILWPTMAPIVLSDPTGWKLPIVTAVMGSSDPVNPATFWYFGNDAVIPNSGWCSPGSMSLYWETFGNSAFVSPCPTTPVAFCNTGATSPCVPTAVTPSMPDGLVLGDAFPNPTCSATLIHVTLPAAMSMSLKLHNSLGQEVRTLADGMLEAGQHTFSLETAALPAGVYFYRLQSEGVSLNKKLVVTK